MSVGFLGLGIMGEPMARRLVEAGIPLTVWNRSSPARDRLVAAGAVAAASVDDVFARSTIVLMMLSTEAVLDDVLGRGTAAFAGRVRGRTLVNSSTVSPAFSRALEADVVAAGGRFVEAPVSGSRLPAERGELVGMLAGDPGAIAEAQPLLEHLCSSTVVCGAVPSALTMKLAVNVFLITQVTGLAETYRFAAAQGLDLAALRTVLDGGQMASAISRAKTAKLADDDLAPQAAISDVLKNARLVADAASAVGISLPLLEASRDLYARAEDAGDGGLDMIGVLRALSS